MKMWNTKSIAFWCGLIGTVFSVFGNVSAGTSFAPSQIVFSFLSFAGIGALVSATRNYLRRKSIGADYDKPWNITRVALVGAVAGALAFLSSSSSSSRADVLVISAFIFFVLFIGLPVFVAIHRNKRVAASNFKPDTAAS